MKKKSEMVSEQKLKNDKKSAGEIVSKLLSVLCVLAVVVLVGVTAFAIMNANNDKAPDAGSVVPEIVTTQAPTEPYTLASADTVKVKGTVYVKKDADVFAEPSSEAAVVTSLKIGDSVGLVSANKQGWCKVAYDGKVCYVLRECLSTKKPDVSQTPATEVAATVASSASQVRKTVNLNQKHWSVVVVDKNRQMPEGYVPELEYIAGTDYELDSRAAGQFNKMYDAAKDEGIELAPYSAYRRYSTQETNYNNLVNQYLGQGYSQQEAEDLAATEILPAGCSEHNLGLAIDIAGTEDSFKNTAEYQWLCENAYKYGFIERYPEGSQDVTGVMAEPWHWRYIGPSYAKDMKAKGSTTLEEYLQSYGKEY